MKGQWIGSYQGSAEGQIMINIDEVDDHYEGVAYLNPSTRGIPASVSYLSTTNKNHEQVATAYINPVEPANGLSVQMGRHKKPLRGRRSTFVRNNGESQRPGQQTPR